MDNDSLLNTPDKWNLSFRSIRIYMHIKEKTECGRKLADWGQDSKERRKNCIIKVEKIIFFLINIINCFA